MTTVLILMGVSGSGKTYIGQQLADQLKWPFYDGDRFHSPDNIEKMRHGIPLTDTDREPWLASLQSLIRHLLQEQRSAVIACSALRQRYRKSLELDPAVKFVYLKGSYEAILQRLQHRENHFMPADLLKSQFETLEEPDNAFVIDISQPTDQIISTVQQLIT